MTPQPEDPHSKQVIGLAIKVHKILGPGLLADVQIGLQAEGLKKYFTTKGTKNAQRRTKLKVKARSAMILSRKFPG